MPRRLLIVARAGGNPRHQDVILCATTTDILTQLNGDRQPSNNQPAQLEEDNRAMHYDRGTTGHATINQHNKRTRGQCKIIWQQWQYNKQQPAGEMRGQGGGARGYDDNVTRNNQPSRQEDESAVQHDRATEACDKQQPADVMRG
jgi:hypothetical protein